MRAAGFVPPPFVEKENNVSDKKPLSDNETARARAQKFFAASEERENQIKQMIESERSKRETKTAKLRALRLAKEEEERKAAADTPAVIVKPRARKTAARSKRT